MAQQCLYYPSIWGFAKYSQEGIDSSGDMTLHFWFRTGNMMDLDRVANTGEILRHIQINGDGRLAIQLNWARGYGDWVNTADGAIVQDSWHHLAITIEAATTTAQVWLDAVLIGTVVSSQSYPATLSGVAVMSRPQWGDAVTQYGVREVKLTAAEIAALYNGGNGVTLTGAEAGLVRLFNISGAPGSGTALLDSSPSGINGYMDGGTEGSDWERIDAAIVGGPSFPGTVGGPSFPGAAAAAWILRGYSSEVTSEVTRTAH